ncbi:hypothetical protein RJ640_007763 [Escallonia rubra]|uniref:Uncharacterized protein n=1 Tax=Escallonia rubra TaxID=112253 RepID=A0AA88QYT0_9ASTE|nr:hypothetical protein RJ640_007763 [Escallonia rubra]
MEITRSGSTYLYGFFDQEWKEGMTKDEAEKLVVKAVSLAIARDGASGGVVRTVIKHLKGDIVLELYEINSDGVTRNFYPGDSLPLWHEELEPQNSLLDILSSSSSEPMLYEYAKIEYLGGGETSAIMGGYREIASDSNASSMEEELLKHYRLLYTLPPSELLQA